MNEAVFFADVLAQHVLPLVAGLVILALLLVMLIIMRKRVIKKSFREGNGTVVIPTGWASGLGELTVASVPHGMITIRRGSRETFVAAGTHVYQYFTIDARPRLSEASMMFRVSKRWLSRTDNMTLSQWRRGAWRTVETAKASEDSSYVYFKANPRETGQFAITGQRKSRSRTLWPIAVLVGIVLLAGIPFLVPHDPEFNGIPRQRWTQDTVHVLDLATFFKDPDMDALTFTATPAGHVDVFIDRSGKAVMTPEQGWAGEERVVFTARDSRGGVVTSNTVSLLVEPSLIPLRYLPYVRAGIIAGIVFILLVLILTARQELVGQLRRK